MRKITWLLGLVGFGMAFMYIGLGPKLTGGIDYWITPLYRYVSLIVLMVFAGIISCDIVKKRSNKGQLTDNRSLFINTLLWSLWFFVVFMGITIVLILFDFILSIFLD